MIFPERNGTRDGQGIPIGIEFRECLDLVVRNRSTYAL